MYVCMYVCMYTVYIFTHDSYVYISRGEDTNTCAYVHADVCACVCMRLQIQTQGQLQILTRMDEHTQTHHVDALTSPKGSM